MKKLLFLALLIVVSASITSFKNPTSKDDFYVIVSKSEYTLFLYDKNNEWLASYPVVFGNNDLGDKLYEGDRRTPEGTFHIIGKKAHQKWDKFLALDYPTEESILKFNSRKANGEIPAGARIGGAIGIHGTWPKEDFAVDNQQNWTQGCVSTKNEYVRELYNMLPVGTRVVIVP